MDTRTCKRCGLQKPCDEFTRQPNLPAGYKAACKQCMRQWWAEYRSRADVRASHASRERERRARLGSVFREQRSRYLHEWRQRPDVKSRRKQYDEDYYRRNGHKRLARREVQNAVYRGVLAAPATLPCTDCGQQAAEYDHHLGYGTPHQLDVQPVCRLCHAKRTRKVKHA